MEYEIKPQSRLSLGLRELWAYRELIYFFAWRDIKVKYKQAVLGFAWAILQPLLMTFVFSFFFKRLVNDSLTIPYPVYVLSGLLMWNIFSTGLNNAGNSMVTNSSIIKKIYFPRLIIPLSAIIVAIFDFITTLIIFILVLWYYKVDPDLLKMTWSIPLSMIITLFATLGPSFLLSALNVRFRDFKYIIPFIIQLLLFVTPVIYPLSMFGDTWVKDVLALNPMYAAIELFRTGITGVPVDTSAVMISLAANLLLFVTGISYFRKTESFFADIA